VKKFDHTLADAQATSVDPVSQDSFPFDEYTDYEAGLLERCARFWNGDSGVLVHRRMRVAEVFSWASADMEQSLNLQLGGLKKSMGFREDVPNFLEPWYGIGTAVSAYGAEYVWNKGQAPAVRTLFGTTTEAIGAEPVPITETSIGRHTIRMIEYFLEKTGGKLPMSYCDVQSPLNSACNLVDINQFMIDLLIDPEPVVQVLDKLAGLIADFTQLQEQMLGDTLVRPGHGFSSCRAWDGFGMSDDNVVMLPDEQYRDLVIPSFEKLGAALGGPVFHSCGNWSGKIEQVKTIRGLKMVDGAFSPQTDPDPNPPEPFRDGLKDTGIVLNARIVGDTDTIRDVVSRLWNPGLRMVVVTNCPTPEEQEKAYDIIHNICQ
jgi:hypothetical protein